MVKPPEEPWSCKHDNDGDDELDGDGDEELNGDGYDELDGDGDDELDQTNNGDGYEELDGDGHDELDQTKDDHLDREAVLDIRRQTRLHDDKTGALHEGVDGHNASEQEDDYGRDLHESVFDGETQRRSKRRTQKNLGERCAKTSPVPTVSRSPSPTDDQFQASTRHRQIEGSRSLLVYSSNDSSEDLDDQDKGKNLGMFQLIDIRDAF